MSFEPEQFEPLVGEPFRIGTEPECLEVTLVEVKRMSTKGQFSVLWRGPDDAMLEQGIYHVAHPSFEAEVFLVTVGPHGDGMAFEAVFS